MTSGSIGGADGTIVVGRLVTAGVVFALLSLAWLLRRAQDRRRRVWPATTGTVTAERFAGYTAGESASYEKVIDFVTADGREISGSPRSSSQLGLDVVGRRVRVWYDPADPRRFDAHVHWTDRAGTFPLLISLPFLLLHVGLWLG